MCCMALRQAGCLPALVFRTRPPAPTPAAAQGRRPVKRATDASPAAALIRSTISSSETSAPRWPAAVLAAVVGVPGDGNVYYVGAAAAGCGRPRTGGESWEAVFKDQPTSSIGALALARLEPPTSCGWAPANRTRGTTWWMARSLHVARCGQELAFMGLGDVGQVSQIVIDPAIRTSSSWPPSATCGRPIPSAACTARPTAARLGRRSCS